MSFRDRDIKTITKKQELIQNSGCLGREGGRGGYMLGEGPSL